MVKKLLVLLTGILYISTTQMSAYAETGKCRKIKSVQQTLEMISADLNILIEKQSHSAWTIASPKIKDYADSILKVSKQLPRNNLNLKAELAGNIESLEYNLRVLAIWASMHEKTSSGQYAQYEEWVYLDVRVTPGYTISDYTSSNKVERTESWAKWVITQATDPQSEIQFLTHELLNQLNCSTK